MKTKRIILISIIMLIFLTLGAVSAEDNLTLTESPDAAGTDINDNPTLLFDDNEQSQSTTHSNETQEANVEFSVPSEILKGESSFYLEFANSGDFEGNVSIFIDNEYADNLYLQPLGMGYQLVEIKNATEGIHTCSLVYGGSNQFKAFNRSYEIEIASVIFHLYEKMYSDSEIMVSLADDATGTVVINVNGTSKRYNLDEYGTSIYYALDKLKCGETYPVEVSYTGNYANISKSMNVTVNYYMGFYKSIASTLTEYLNGFNDEFIFFEIGAPGEVKVLIDGADIHYDKTDDLPGSISRSPNYYDGCIFDQAPIWLYDLYLSKGYHTIEIICLGNGKYPAQSINETFYLEKPILPSFAAQLINTPRPITFLFEENTTGNVSISVSSDGRDYRLADSKEIINNTAVVNSISSNIGTNHMKIISSTQNGTEEINGTFEVLAARFEYDNWFERFVYASSEREYTDTFRLECGEGVTGKFSIYIENCNAKEKKLYKTVKIRNGKAEIVVPNTAYSKKVGTYRLVGIWKTNYGKGSDITSFIDVIKVPTIVKAPKVTNRKYFKVTVKHGESKKPVKKITLKLKIGKKTYKVKTNKKGVAKFATKKLGTGIHKVKITSASKNYDIKATSQIKIKG